MTRGQGMGLGANGLHTYATVITARKRSVFTRHCLSTLHPEGGEVVHPWGGGASTGRCILWGGSQPAGGMHPTGMHPC